MTVLLGYLCTKSQSFIEFPAYPISITQNKYYRCKAVHLQLQFCRFNCLLKHYHLIFNFKCVLRVLLDLFQNAINIFHTQ